MYSCQYWCLFGASTLVVCCFQAQLYDTKILHTKIAMQWRFIFKNRHHMANIIIIITSYIVINAFNLALFPQFCALNGFILYYIHIDHKLFHIISVFFILRTYIKRQKINQILILCLFQINIPNWVSLFTRNYSLPLRHLSMDWFHQPILLSNETYKIFVLYS